MASELAEAQKLSDQNLLKRFHQSLFGEGGPTEMNAATQLPIAAVAPPPSSGICYSDATLLASGATIVGLTSKQGPKRAVREGELPRTVRPRTELCSFFNDTYGFRLPDTSTRDRKRFLYIIEVGRRNGDEYGALLSLIFYWKRDAGLMESSILTYVKYIIPAIRGEAARDEAKLVRAAIELAAIAERAKRGPRLELTIVTFIIFFRTMMTAFKAGHADPGHLYLSVTGFRGVDMRRLFASQIDIDVPANAFGNAITWAKNRQKLAQGTTIRFTITIGI